MNKFYSLTSNDIEVLEFLYESSFDQKLVTINDIIDLMISTPKDIRRSIGNLADAGLVEVEDLDNQQNVVSITDEGLRTYAAFEAGAFCGSL